MQSIVPANRGGNAQRYTRILSMWIKDISLTECVEILGSLEGYFDKFAEFHNSDSDDLRLE